MRRLLWKELCERAWWLGCWALATLGVAFFDGQWWHAQGVLITPWLALPFVLALVVGTGAYASELGGGRAPFLYARPVRWQAVLGAKVLVGMAVIVIMPLLAGILYWRFGPEVHCSYVTAGTIFANTWPLMWVMAVLYLTGLSCSVLLPGLAGGLLTLIGVVLVAIAVFAVGQGVISWEYSRELTIINGTIIGTVLAALCAGLPLTRFGLTLGVDARMKCFAPTYTLVLLAVVITSMVLPMQLTDRLLLRWDPIRTSVSPGGTYVYTAYTSLYFPPGYRVGWEQSNENFFAGKAIVRRLDGRGSLSQIPFDLLRGSATEASVWANDRTMYVNDSSGKGMALYYPATGRVVRFTGTIAANYRLNPPVPDRRYLLVRMGNTSAHVYRCIDLQTAQMLPMVVQTEHRIWWQNPHTLAYISEWDGKRHTVDVSR